jgi:hypothetical protein
VVATMLAARPGRNTSYARGGRRHGAAGKVCRGGYPVSPDRVSRLTVGRPAQGWLGVGCHSPAAAHRKRQRGRPLPCVQTLARREHQAWANTALHALTNGRAERLGYIILCRWACVPFQTSCDPPRRVRHWAATVRDLARYASCSDDDLNDSHLRSQASLSRCGRGSGRAKQPPGSAAWAGPRTHRREHNYGSDGQPRELTASEQSR